MDNSKSRNHGSQQQTDGLCFTAQKTQKKSRESEAHGNNSFSWRGLFSHACMHAFVPIFLHANRSTHRSTPNAVLCCVVLCCAVPCYGVIGWCCCQHDKSSLRALSTLLSCFSSAATTLSASNSIATKIATFSSSTPPTVRAATPGRELPISAESAASSE